MWCIGGSWLSAKYCSARRRTAVAALLLATWAVFAWPWAAFARTWQVEQDPNQPVDQIGQVVLAAGSGDSVIIGPGTYYEHILVAHKSITLRRSDRRPVRKRCIFRSRRQWRFRSGRSRPDLYPRNRMFVQLEQV